MLGDGREYAERHWRKQTNVLRLSGREIKNEYTRLTASCLVTALEEEQGQGLRGVWVYMQWCLHAVAPGQWCVCCVRGLTCVEPWGEWEVKADPSISPHTQGPRRGFYSRMPDEKLVWQFTFSTSPAP